MLSEVSSYAVGDSSRLHRDASASPAHARVSSSYSQFIPGSPQRFPPNSIGSSFQSPADAHPKAQNGLYSRSRDSEYTQNALTRSPVHRATPSSPYHRALPGSSPLRSPAHAAAVSAVEQQLHASLHEEQGLLRSAQGRPAPNSPSALPAYYPTKENMQSRLSSAGAYQPWRGHLESQQYSAQQQRDVADSLSQPSRLSQVPHDSHSLSHSFGPVSQHLGHASPELDSLSQRLRDQKLAMGGQEGRFGTSPLQARGASLSPSTDHTGSGAGPRSTGLGSTYMHSARPDPSPSRCDHPEQCSPMLFGHGKGCCLEHSILVNRNPLFNRQPDPKRSGMINMVAEQLHGTCVFDRHCYSFFGLHTPLQEWRSQACIKFLLEQSDPQLYTPSQPHLQH